MIHHRPSTRARLSRDARPEACASKLIRVCVGIAHVTTGRSRGDRHLDAPDGTGFIVSVEQLAGNSVFHVYRREGEPDRPHDHSRELFAFTAGADETDGIDVTSTPLGSEFSNGLVVAMNSAAKNFLLVPWRTALVDGARGADASAGR